ncbi:MAG: histidinol phosphatase [Acidobacteriota bacterium]
MRIYLLIMTLMIVLLPAAIRDVAPQGRPKLGPGRKYTTIERVQPERLAALHRGRLARSGTRHEVRLATDLRDYRAILHAHAEDATHTGGTRPEMLAAAKRAGVQVIMLTDHVRPQRDFINDSWRGMREGVLFIPGAEAEGFLVYPQRSIKGEPFSNRAEYIALAKRGGGDIFLSHVEERFDWPTAELDGLEIYNNHTDIKDEGPFLMWLTSALSDPARLSQLSKALDEYPTEFFGASQDYLTPIIEKWDRDLLTNRSTGVAANDCHHNQGFTIRVGTANSIEILEMVGGDKPRTITVEQQPRIAEMIQGRKAGDVIARIDIDPYERSMNFVSTHILASELNEESVRDALRRSHAYVAHDWLTDPTGFAFVARDEGSSRNLGIMGDEIALRSKLQLQIEAPGVGAIKLFHNGRIVGEAESDRMVFKVEAPGVYRVEIWLSVDGELRPWIYSNAIRVLPR